MKKLFTIKKIHENKNYESQILTHNINIYAFEKELFTNATICNNADIEEKYINRIATYNDVLYVVKIRIYVDTRTNTIYSYRLTNNYNGYDYYINLLEQLPENVIIPLQYLKPENNTSFYYEEDYIKLIEALI